ncbi:MAG: thiamine-phosphate diphosphorylase [Candidatus Aminicenantes bacterium RBG_13_63_10]|nr:MAG: thiamine-phosphate diphosphorylase [Candidatus Aminicenantes bacterium RBG_13_63_10]
MKSSCRPGGRRPAPDWRLCLVADPEAAAGRDLAFIVLAAVDAGVTIVQLRAKNLITRHFLALAKTLAAQLKRRRIPFVINDRVDIALACGASGVHLGRDDMPCAEARKIMGRERLIGLSVTEADEAEQAEALGADYLGVWPVFPTATKETGLPPLGIDGLRGIRSRVKIPILAIGGIKAANAAQVMAAGADGVAVVSAICSAPDPAQAAAALLAGLGPRRRRR